jgi:hypothetical protein
LIDDPLIALNDVAKETGEPFSGGVVVYVFSYGFRKQGRAFLQEHDRRCLPPQDWQVDPQKPLL